MKTMTLIMAATVLGIGAASAQSTTVIEREGSTNTVIEKRSDPVVIEKRKVETTGSVGCSTETKQKTDEFGDTKTKTTERC